MNQDRIDEIRAIYNEWDSDEYGDDENTIIVLNTVPDLLAALEEARAENEELKTRVRRAEAFFHAVTEIVGSGLLDQIRRRTNERLEKARE